MFSSRVTVLFICTFFHLNMVAYLQLQKHVMLTKTLNRNFIQIFKKM